MGIRITYATRVQSLEKRRTNECLSYLLFPSGLVVDDDDEEDDEEEDIAYLVDFVKLALIALFPLFADPVLGLALVFVFVFVSVFVITFVAVSFLPGLTTLEGTPSFCGAFGAEGVNA